MSASRRRRLISFDGFQPSTVGLRAFFSRFGRGELCPDQLVTPERGTLGAKTSVSFD
jgi:hypothetical protein